MASPPPQGYIREREHRDFGKMTFVGCPNVYSDTPNPDLAPHAPYTGEHNAEVLEKDLGFSAAEAATKKRNLLLDRQGGTRVTG